MAGAAAAWHLDRLCSQLFGNSAPPDRRFLGKPRPPRPRSRPRLFPVALLPVALRQTELIPALPFQRRCSEVGGPRKALSNSPPARRHSRLRPPPHSQRHSREGGNPSRVPIIRRGVWIATSPCKRSACHLLGDLGPRLRAVDGVERSGMTLRVSARSDGARGLVGRNSVFAYCAGHECRPDIARRRPGSGAIRQRPIAPYGQRRNRRPCLSTSVGK